MEWNNKPFFDMVSNSVMSDLYTKHALKLGVDFVNHPSTGETGSTDMGNVSYVVPSIHPFFYIGSTAVNHTRDFTVASGTYIFHQQNLPTAANGFRLVAKGFFFFLFM